MHRLLEAGDEPVTAPHPWRIAASLLLSLAGVGVSIYLTIAHYVGTQILACSGSGVIDCAKVTTSAQSHFLGMPVAVLGLAFYLVMTAINLPWAWRSPDRRVHLARLVLMAGGMAFVLYLVSAELLIIGNICIWCTAVHVITFLLFALVVGTVPAMLGWNGVQDTEAGPDRVRRSTGAGPRRPAPGRAGGRQGSGHPVGSRVNGNGHRAASSPNQPARTTGGRRNGQGAGGGGRPAGTGPKGRPDR